MTTSNISETITVTGARKLNLVDCLQELLVALGASKYDVDPYPHRLRTGRHQVQRAVSCLDAERECRVGTAYRLPMVDVDVLDRLERDGTARRRPRLQLVGVVVEASPATVEDEPAPVPGAQLAAHLGQVAVAGARSHLDVPALSEAVPGGLDELTQVERRLAHRQVASERPSCQRRPLHHNETTADDLSQPIFAQSSKMETVAKPFDARLANRPFLTRATLAIARVLAVIVCLCVCLSHAGIVSKGLNTGSCK